MQHHERNETSPALRCATRTRRFVAVAFVAAAVAMICSPAGATAQSRGTGRRTSRPRAAAPRPITVTSIQLALDDGGEPGEVVDKFSPADNPMHFIVRYDPPRTGTRFDVKLWAVRLLERDERDVVVGDLSYVSKALENRINVQFELPRDWPAGTWKITVHANNVLLAQHEFQVIDPRPAKPKAPDDEIAAAARCSLSSE